MVYKTLRANVSEQYLRFSHLSLKCSAFTLRAANNHHHHRNKGLREYLVQKQLSFPTAEEFNCVTQAEVTPQDQCLRAKPAQLQLF